MTVILDNGHAFSIIKIEPTVGGMPRSDISLDIADDTPLAVWFEPAAQSSVGSRSWWWVAAKESSAKIFRAKNISIVQKEKHLLSLMQGHANRWYRYTGKNDRHNADLVKEI